MVTVSQEADERRATVEYREPTIQSKAAAAAAARGPSS